MLKRIHIQNYALIEEIEVAFDRGFTAITGETGSGKSILLGALRLVLGERADTHVLFNKNQKCIVEVDFDLSAMNLQGIFETEDLDYLQISTFRREISPAGRSRSFVNDTPCSLNILRKITAHLVDVHSQHQTLLINAEDFQIKVLDLFCSHQELLDNYFKVYQSYLKNEEEIKKLLARIKDQSIDKDYLEFQLNELSEIVLIEGEDERLKEELGLLQNIATIEHALQKSVLELDAEQGILDRLNTLSHRLDGVSTMTQGLSELSERVDSLRLELQDISGTIHEIGARLEHDPEREIILSDSIDAYQRLFSKHKVDTIIELIALKSEIESRLDLADTAADELKKLQSQSDSLRQEMSRWASALTESRISGKEGLIEKVSNRFPSLSMPNAALDIEISESSDYHALGRDSVALLFNANKGGTLEPLYKVASGGELSRLMLILKQELAQAQHLPTLIFDEIDSGVSGEVASKMAGLLREMAQDRQVISITHIPQVAARAARHYRVSKSDTAERSITDLEILDDDGRILELAKMLSGTSVSEASVENARDLMKN